LAASTLFTIVVIIFWVLYMYYVKHQILVGTARVRKVFWVIPRRARLQPPNPRVAFLFIGIHGF